MHVDRENASELLLCVYPAVKVREICEQITVSLNRISDTVALCGGAVGNPEDLPCRSFKTAQPEL